ncbi:hypothetical protein PLICRDRAFT_54766 [Plicaturopsis crispa FD-325 SS-3]|nr:hypothetical protein PLICRDRAFT_54766 [Plicaturopsis crispa FD-325 SS-3]
MSVRNHHVQSSNGSLVPEATTRPKYDVDRCSGERQRVRSFRVVHSHSSHPPPGFRRTTSPYHQKATTSTSNRAASCAFGDSRTTGFLIYAQTPFTPQIQNPPQRRRIILASAPHLPFRRADQLTARHATDLGTTMACQYGSETLITYTGHATATATAQTASTA